MYEHCGIGIGNNIKKRQRNKKGGRKEGRKDYGGRGEEVFTKATWGMIIFKSDTHMTRLT